MGSFRVLAGASFSFAFLFISAQVANAQTIARLPESLKTCHSQDQCGVCDGDNSTCAGCDGVPNSNKTYDECGVCDGPGGNECGCDISEKVFSEPALLKETYPGSMRPEDAILHELNEKYNFVTRGKDYYLENWPEGTPLGYKWLQAGNGNWFYLKPDGTFWLWAGNTTDLSGDSLVATLNGTKDICGVCWGNSASCLGCDGVANSGLELDECGECGGDNSSCAGCDGVPNSGKSLDECGVCDGDSSSCAGCDGILNSGLELDECGVCGGDGSSCEVDPNCVYEVSVYDCQSSVDRRNGGREVQAACDDPDGALIQGEGANLACLETFLSDIWFNLDEVAETYRGILADRYIDQYIYSKNLVGRAGVKDTYRAFLNAIHEYMTNTADPTKWILDGELTDEEVAEKLSLYEHDLRTLGRCKFDDDNCTTLLNEKISGLYDDMVASIFDYLFGRFTNLDIVFDSNCRPKVFDPTTDILCGALNVFWHASPISLYWEPEGTFTVEETIVKFPLQLGAKEEWTTWRASGKLPLVVWDPEHTGRIDSAKQLFGNWTFGGKNAHLASISNSVIQPQPWEHGYEALATLDQNSDGEISGEELESLGLWFDYDQDGVSEEGEVQCISATGITKLFYNFDRKDPETRDLHASVGYERVVDQQTVNGASVDWYGTPSNSYFEAVSKERLQHFTRTNEDRTEREPTKSSTNKAGQSLFSGVWKWEASDQRIADDRRSFPIGGHFVLSRTKDGIRGSSFRELPLKTNKNGMKSVMRARPIKGRIVEGADGIQTLHFKVTHRDGTYTESTARFDKDKKTLIGKSTGTIAKKSGSVLKIDYNWSAKKMDLN